MKVAFMSSVRIKDSGPGGGDGRVCVYHCMSRVCGKDRLLGGLECEVFRKQMRQLAEFCGVEVLTYAVMSNHFHILVRVPGEAGIGDVELVRRVGVLYGRERAKVVERALRGTEAEAVRAGYLARMGDVSQYMKELKQRFSIWYNRRHGRVGTLWSERYKSVLVENGGRALRTVGAYIDLNPVRAGCCGDPKEYRYCGYGEACGGGRAARAGVAGLMEMGGGRGAWRRAGREYRLILFGKGYYGRGDAGKIAPERLRRVRREGGKLALADALRCRVKYFGYGTILGSREYVEEVFGRHREKFGERRQSGARRMRGAEWEGLWAARELRKDVYV